MRNYKEKFDKKMRESFGKKNPKRLFMRDMTEFMTGLLTSRYGRNSWM